MKRELTNKEKQVLRLSGYPRKEIAKKLCITLGTVQDHLTHIRRKLCVKSREQSLIVALKNNILDIQDVDCGFWNNEGIYIEDIQPVDFSKE